MEASALMQVLHQLPKTDDPALLVGTETSDDAAVYRISDDLAVVTSLDFFPPIVDDPYTFGGIAAANALSDIYAMGATPRFATNMVCFPRKLDTSVLLEILRGSTDKLREAGALLVGGHSIEDREIKYGLSVTGFVDPARMVTNSGAKEGDLLLLTKPIGTGVITSAVKAGRLSEAGASEAVSSMLALNRGASEAMIEVGVNACTDITGFGLLGHAFEMADASGVSMVIRSGDVPFFRGATELVLSRKNRPRAIASNMDFLKDRVEVSPDVTEAVELLLHDPQTSGGLLISVPRERAGDLRNGLEERGGDAFVIGEVTRKMPRTIVVEGA